MNLEIYSDSHHYHLDSSRWSTF